MWTGSKRKIKDRKEPNDRLEQPDPEPTLGGQSQDDFVKETPSSSADKTSRI